MALVIFSALLYVLPAHAIWNWTTIHTIDLTLQKTAQVVSGSVDTISSTGKVLANDRVRYQLSYQNEGTTWGNNFVLSGSIAPGMCYVLWTLEANLLTGYTLSYSNDETGATWTYTPTGVAGVRDCAIKYFKLEKSLLSGSAQLIDRSNITGGVRNNVVYLSSGVTIDPLSIYSHVAPNPIKPIIVGAGNSGWGGVSSREFFQSGHYYRIRQDGTVKRLRFYVDHKTNLTGFYFKIRRQNTGGNFDLVWQSENLIPNINSWSISDIVLSSPITGVQEGDYYGFHMLWTTNGWQLNIPVEAGVGGQNMYFITNTWGAGSDFPWPTAWTFTTSTYPIEVYMDQADSVFIGASLVAWHPPHYSFIETLPRTFITWTIQHFFSEFSSLTTQNMGMGSQTIASVVSRFERDVLNINPKMVVVSIGFNDIALGTSKANYMSWRRHILNVTENAANIQKVVILLLTPWTEGGTGRNITKDDRNQSVTELAAEYSKTVVVDAAPYIGVEYTWANAVSGNLWYLDAAYDYGDGVHLTTSGNRRVAQAIYDTLVSGNVTLNNNLFGNFTLLFTGSDSFTKWKNLFTDITLPTNTSATYSVRPSADQNCALYTGNSNSVIDNASASNSQISLAALSWSAYQNLCVTVHMKTTDRATTPTLTGLIATYAESPLTLTYDTVINDTSASMSSRVSMYSTSGALVSANYGWSILQFAPQTFAGGGGGSLKYDYCPAWDFSPTFFDGICGQTKPVVPNPVIDEPVVDNTVNEEKDEISAAYDWAHDQKITTLSPQSEARLYDPITREELAKMIATYAMQFTNKSLSNREACTSYIDLQDASFDLQDDIIMACKLWLMGITNDWTPLQEFRPFDKVTRAEFGTILSRILRGSLYETSWEGWFTQHLQALYNANIMKKIETPSMEELRWWILLMLRRQSGL